MTRASLTCVLLIALAATQTGSIVALQPAPATTIPFEVANRHIVVQVKVNNSRPLSFVLDTGANRAIVRLEHGQGARADSPRRRENRRGRIRNRSPGSL